MLTVLLAALLQAEPSSAASSQPSKAPAVRNIHPKWLQSALGSDIAAHYPQEAARQYLAGRATIACTVNGEGRLEGCKVVAEEPVGYGFGEAAVSVGALFRMGAVDQAGKPTVGETVKMPIRFLSPSSYETSPKRFRDPSFSEARVDLDCRFTGPRLDNCMTVRAEPAGTPMEQVAKDLTELMDMAPQRQKRGRIVIPMLFTPEPLPSKNGP